MKAEDCSAHCVGEFPGDKTADYAEGIFVGYRYYDTYDKKVLFPFGYGLSYTEFSYENLCICEKWDVISGEKKYEVSLDIKNIGGIPGKETVQIYVGKKNSDIVRAAKELRGFAKTELAPGERKKIKIELDSRSFQYFDENREDFITEGGTYEIYAARSVNEICREISWNIEK